MKLTITAKNFKLTEALREIVEAKMKKIESYIPNPVIRVVLEANKPNDKVEILIFNKNKVIKAEATDEDLYLAIDLAYDNLRPQLEKYVDKKGNYENTSIRFTTPQRNNLEEEKEKRKRIVKRKYFDLKPMMEEEAILQMELLGHHSFMFFNAEIDAICLLYRRKDGNYGLIEKM